MSSLRLRMGLALGPAIVLALALGTAAAATDPGGSPSGDGVDPVFVAGNPSCATLNANNATFPSITGDYGFKLDGAPVGTFTFTNPPGVLTGGAPSDPSNSVTISNVVNSTFDWSATLGIDAVIVKGGPDSNAFVYVPEDKADTDLHAPVNPNNGDFYGLSHIEFCYDYELTATKTANAKYTREYSWKITKDVDGEYWKFIGDDYTRHYYKVSVDQTVKEYDFLVDGTITVKNPTPYTATFTVTDYVGTTKATVTCPKYTLASGESTVCTYTADLGDVKPADGTNTATITSTTPGVEGTTATAPYAFGEPTTVIGYKDINVTDMPTGQAWKASGDATWEYPVAYGCTDKLSLYVDGVNEYTVVNTAKITETGQSDIATVKVHCYAPVPSKDAATKYSREYSWKITKDFDGEYWKFIGDGTTTHNYKVAVDQTIAESGFMVYGTITVKNPNPKAAMTVALADSVGGTAATLSCGGTLVVPAGSTATCGYKAALGTKTDGTNTATATFNTLAFTATADYKFGEPTTVVGYKDINVTDTNGEKWMASGDKTWEYTFGFLCPDDVSRYTAGVYSYDWPNTAKITETGQEDSALVKVHCYAPLATKDAATKYTRSYDWTITKDYDGEYWKFIGDPATTHGYKVVVDQTMSESGFMVYGTITVTNPNPKAAMTVAVSDYVATTMADLSCGGTLVVPAGGTATCGYKATLPAKTDGTNKATVTLNKIGVKATADYKFGDATVSTVGYKDINVTDTNGKAWTASGDAFWEYTKDFACPTDVNKYTAGVHNFSHENTAKITETGQLDKALVKVHCYAPTVAKTADTASFDQYYTWTLTKSVSPESQWGYAGQKLAWKWTVKVTADALAADKPFVSGTITIKNPNPKASMTVGLADKLSDGTVAKIFADADCGYAAGSLTIPMGGTATCDYLANPTGVTATYNEATVTFASMTFIAKADVLFTAVDMNAKAKVTDIQIGLDKELTGPGTWTFDKAYDHTCSTAAKDYAEDGTYSKTLDNEAKLAITGDGTLTAKASTTYTCKAGFMDLLKLTEGEVDATMKWNFALYKGPDGFGTTPIGTGTTFEDADGVLHFGDPALRPDKTYTVCELTVPAGWDATWEVNGVPVTPYDPDQNNTVPEDLGNRCVDFGAGTAIPVKVGETVHFKVDNSYPGGDPRTPGYWKNWNTCTKGNQAATAAANGGPEEGFWLLEDVFTINGPIVWDDILTDDITFTIKTCPVAVDLLDKRLIGDPALVGDGKKVASKPLHNLAAHLLAAQLNFGAGACTTPTVLSKAQAAEKLLDKYDFKGTLTYKMPLTTTDATTANSLAKYLDDYNNGKYCGSTMP